MGHTLEVVPVGIDGFEDDVEWWIEHDDCPSIFVEETPHGDVWAYTCHVAALLDEHGEDAFDFEVRDLTPGPYPIRVGAEMDCPQGALDFAAYACAFVDVIFFIGLGEEPEC